MAEPTTSKQEMQQIDLAQGAQSLALVDFDLTTSIVCPIVLGQLLIWQNWQGTLATWRNSENQSRLKLGSDLRVHPVNWLTLVPWILQAVHVDA